jgi:hypothetical protein
MTGELDRFSAEFNGFSPGFASFQRVSGRDAACFERLLSQDLTR